MKRKVLHFYFSGSVLPTEIVFINNMVRNGVAKLRALRAAYAENNFVPSYRRIVDKNIVVILCIPCCFRRRITREMQQIFIGIPVAYVFHRAFMPPQHKSLAVVFQQIEDQLRVLILMLLVQFVAYAFSAQCVVICTQNDCGSALADLFIERIPCFFSENTTLGFETTAFDFFASSRASSAEQTVSKTCWSRCFSPLSTAGASVWLSACFSVCSGLPVHAANITTDKTTSNKHTIFSFYSPFINLHL